MNGKKAENVRKGHAGDPKEVSAQQHADHGNDLNILVTVKFMENEAFFTMLDDGKCIALDKDEETRELITDNYGLLKKVAKSFRYQYILNLNYSVFTFS